MEYLLYLPSPPVVFVLQSYPPPFRRKESRSDTKIQRQRERWYDRKIERYKDITIQGYTVTRIQRYKDIKMNRNK